MPAPNGNNLPAHAGEASMGYAQLACGTARVLAIKKQGCRSSAESQGDAVERALFFGEGTAARASKIS